MSGIISNKIYNQVIASSALALSGPADTSENTLVTISLPGGLIGSNGLIRVRTFWTLTSSANNKTTRIRYSGGAGTAIAPYVYTTVAAADVTAHLQNRNSLSSQMATAMSLTNSGNAITAPQTLSVDTTATTTIVITAQKASAGETMTLEGYIVELLKA